MINMKQEAATIIFAIIFIAVLGFYLVLNTTEDASMPETAIIADVLDEPTENSQEEIVDVLPQQTLEEEQDVAAGVTDEVDASSFLDSFDSQAIEGEFEDVQAGIDLLNNPLQ